jgi:hypothetical protein
VNIYAVTFGTVFAERVAADGDQLASVIATDHNFSVTGAPTAGANRRKVFNFANAQQQVTRARVAGDALGIGRAMP